MDQMTIKAKNLGWQAALLFLLFVGNLLLSANF